MMTTNSGRSSKNITVNAMNPGLVATNVGDTAGGFTARMKGLVDKIAALTPEEGEQTILYLAASPQVNGVTGRYFVREESGRSSKNLMTWNFVASYGI